jgi:2',3'-cyclic-nucleotide 2'-phosphodiesterase (5'-nucleotidase family)
MNVLTESSVTLSIVHTNDFHNQLDVERAEVLRGAVHSLQGKPYLLLDAGDAIKAGNVDFNPLGEPILDRMSDLGYHAMTMGNREFHVWGQGLQTKINRARFPVLSANVRPKKEGTALPVVPHATFEVGGLFVKVFGLTVPMVTERSKAAPLSEFLFDDPIVTAKAQVTALRYGADVLIALTHIGLPQDKRLAEAVTGIDLIIGGHSHDTLSEPLWVNGTPIVQTGSHARNYGIVTVTVSRADKPTITGVLHPFFPSEK